ncbi:MAG: glutamyl-tRNA reductase [Bacteroidota bacterium]
MIECFQIIAITHKKVDINHLGVLFLDEEKQKKTLPTLKKEFGFSELMLLSTCNRVELVCVHENQIDEEQFQKILKFLFPELSHEQFVKYSCDAEYYTGDNAISHLFSVSAGLDSMVVGEREIITQIRKAYEFCRGAGLTGDVIRIAIQQAIVTAKEIYSQTDIAKNPVSIVSLAYRKLREFNVPQNARFILVGAGETISTMAKYLKKHQFANFYIYNRTFSRAEILANELGGKAFSLNEIINHSEGFDVIITCTSSSEYIISEEIYTNILGNDESKKTIVDLAVPGDIDEKVIERFNVNLIDISTLKELSIANLTKREKELEKCNVILENRLIEFRQIYKERALEIALSELPKRVKEIRELAVNEVFAKQLKNVDENSRKLIEEVMAYMEKKYNAIAMRTAKESLLESKQANKTF